MISRALAPAKVNLFLHVGPVQPDGYHPVASWMVFADVGDELDVSPAPKWSFAVDGPFAGAIGEGENLVERAAHLLFERAGVQPLPVHLRLTKVLPVAAGLGGGSSDAGGALRLLNAMLPASLPEAHLLELAGELGADGPACLLARSTMAEGVGDALSPAPVSPPLPAVLVNPRRLSPTGAVYRAYDGGRVRTADRPVLPQRLSDPAAVAELLAATRNDLEEPAARLEPAIADALAVLRSAPEALLVRMSGSGATCFALCADEVGAESLALRVQQTHPGWWVRPCRLGAPITNS